MRTLTLPILLFAAVITAPAAAQNFYVPDNDPTLGSCNVIPFGSATATGTFANSLFQTRCTQADLGALPNLITGLGFAACSSGRAYYDQIEIVIDHIPASQLLSTTFANNLTPSAVTVLSASNYTWNVIGNTWNEIGLQQPFVYNGTDDIVVQVAMTNGLAPAGFHRGTRQRIYWTGASGPAPATGTSGLAASKIEVGMLMARTSSHGDGCAGSNGTPQHNLGGSAQIGFTVSFDLQYGVANGIAVLVVGTTNASPFPTELSLIGAPGCSAYTDLAVTLPVVLDAVGSGSLPFAIPLAAGAGFLFYSQYACLDQPANALGITTSNYGRVLVGN